jgi:D-beta-D-heptose 7-phosphate kinase/D-beta-D-heptose 1-phosphate adenosyltransferase
VKTRLVGLAQHRHPQQLLRVDREETKPAETLKQLVTDERMKEALGNANAMLLQDYNKGFLNPQFIPGAIAAAKERGVPVLVDPALIADYGRYREATLITPNRYEASLAGGEQIGELPPAPLPSGSLKGTGRREGQPDTAQLARVAGRLIERAMLEYVVITLDKEGIYLAGAPGANVAQPPSAVLSPPTAGPHPGAGVPHHSGILIPARPRTIYDVTGAGDMVLAVLGLCWNQAGLSPVEAVALANMAGGLEVEKFGSVPISRGELLAEIHAGIRGRSKLWDLPALLGEVERLRSAGRRISFTNGCFDILHPGHVQSLQFARDQGDVLIVGLNSNASVRRIKGPGRPVCTQQERAAVLSGLSCVDYVVVFEQDSVYELVKAIGPDILVKGADRAGNVVGSDLVEARGGKVVLAKFVEGNSTTDVIRRIQDSERH